MFTLCLKNALCNIRSNHPSVMLVRLISIIYNMQLHASPSLRGRQFSGEDLRAGKLWWENCARVEKRAFSRLPFSPPTRSSPALILTDKIQTVKYQVHFYNSKSVFSNIKSILQKLFHNLYSMMM